MRYKDANGIASCLHLSEPSRFKVLLAVNGFFDINRNLTLKVIHLA